MNLASNIIRHYTNCRFSINNKHKYIDYRIGLTFKLYYVGDGKNIILPSENMILIRLLLRCNMPVLVPLAITSPEGRKGTRPKVKEDQ